ncbi:MAG: aromatic ring-hydroxylating dioxygenase subunit alpha [Alphaproteobacteria bacterium]
MELQPKLTREFPDFDLDPMPVEPYLSDDIYDMERERIFRRSWLMVGRVEEIPDPGDFLVKNLDVLNASIIVIRAKNGEVRAFHNVCKHRASRLLSGTGSRKYITCPFHGWTYDIEGNLLSVTQEEAFPSLCKSENGLAPVHVDTWAGKIFINLLKEPMESLPDFLGGMKAHLDPYPFEDLVLVGKYTQVLDANWKLAMHNTQEIYHLPGLHSRTIPGGFSAIEKVRFYGPHQIGSNAGDANYKPTPAERIAQRLGSTASEEGAALSRGMRDQALRGLNVDNLKGFAFDFATIFPNHIMTIGDGWVFSYNYWPISAKRTLLEINRFYERPKKPSDVIGREFALVVMREADCEDGLSIEECQKGLSSGTMNHIHFGDQEILCRHLHKVATDWIAKK